MNNAYENRSGRETGLLRTAMNNASDAGRRLMTRRPNGQFYETVVVLWLTLSVASVVLATATWVRLSRQLNAASQAVAIRLEADSIFQILLDAESSQRGYVITGNPSFLALLDACATNLPVRFDNLARLSRTDPSLLKRVMELRGLAESSLIRQQRVVLAMQQAGPADASEIVGSGKGKAILDSFRSKMAAIGATPSELVFNQGAGARAQLTRASLTSLAAGVLGLGAGLFAFVLSRLAVKHQVRERELIQAKFEADRRNEEKTAFLANMSHEIRTPMSAILGFGELLENDRLNDKQRGYLQSIRRSASSLMQLINDMLDMSKIEAGVLELRPEPTDPREIFQFIQTMFAEPAARKHLNLSCKIEPGLPASLLLDRVRLRQILVNLVGNAVKFTDQGSVELHIRGEDQIPGELLTLLIDVKDNGVGIPRDRLEAIFNPFVQAGAHPEKERQGTGLGLAIVKRLAEKMGGSVIVTSELKQGSVFQLRLPDVSVSRCLPASEQPVRTMAADFNRLRQATVLGVDDNETNRQLLQAMLGGSHHRLLLASNGWEAIEMALDAKPDLILLDLRMPKMDGRNVLRALHDIQSLQLTPVIAVTASSLPADQADIASWFNGCLQKPFSGRELFDEMARFLPRFQKELAPLDQPAATEQAPSHWASDFTPDKMKSSGGEKGQLSSALTHDIKSSLAGVVMSAELLLGQAACLNDEAARRLVNEILVPGRLILAWVKNFSEGAAAQGAPAPGSKAQSGQARAMSPDAFRAHCTHMRADAEALRGQITQRAERRSVVLAENIIRSCTELSNAVEKLSAHCSAIKKSRPILPDHSEAAARAAERYRQRSHNKQTRLLTLTYAAHGLSGC